VPNTGGVFEVLTVRCQLMGKHSETAGVHVWLEYVRRTPPDGGEALVVLRAVWDEHCPFPLTASKMGPAHVEMSPHGRWKVRAG
jgi:hypothetical protein